jgi:hypothetical protein
MRAGSAIAAGLGLPSVTTVAAAAERTFTRTGTG